MPLASITRIANPDRTSAPGMRSTDGQDRILETPGNAWLRDRRVLITAAVALLLLGAMFLIWLLGAWASSDSTVSRDRLRIATVTRGEFLSDVAAQGTVVAAVSPTLYAPAAGTVTLSRNAGDAVKKGDLVATVDSPGLRNEFQRERATLDSLVVDLRRQEIEVRRKILQSQQTSDMAGVAIRAAEREFARAEQAWEQKVISARDYQRARDELDEAKLTHHHAIETAGLEKEGLEFELQTRRLQRDRQKLLVADLERRVGDLEVKSPVDGIVGTLAVTQKAAVQQDAAIVTVVDLSALEVEFRVAESYAGAIGLRMPAEVSLAGKTYAGEVTAMSPEVRQGEVTGRVRLKELPPGLRQNQRVSVRILMDERDDVLKVERGAFYEAEGGAFAYVVLDDVAERKPIRTGAVSVREIEITEGLAEGDQIVISDTDDFKNAARVLLAD
ncbi:MAG TPA: HlyD family efflux transporter periplasmic adaptor subunit [Steroidobacteraceae bacterium]|jgi:HlyD family secretion protein|nr:HlyD family efflux transporter periplasmic adaptor subunit [Steroidobacteraceae bacterium]